MHCLAGSQRSGLIDTNRILNAREKTFFNHIFKKEVFSMKPGSGISSQKAQTAPKILRRF